MSAEPGSPGLPEEACCFSGDLYQIDYSSNTDLKPEDLHQDWGYLMESHVLSLHPSAKSQPPAHKHQVSLNFQRFY